MIKLEKILGECFQSEEKALAKYKCSQVEAVTIIPNKLTDKPVTEASSSSSMEFIRCLLTLREFVFIDESRASCSCFKYCKGDPTKEDSRIASEFVAKMPTRLFTPLADRTEEDHIIYVKFRALQYLEGGELHEALASIRSDLKKHPKTQDHPAIKESIRGEIEGRLSHPTEVKNFINYLDIAH